MIFKITIFQAILDQGSNDVTLMVTRNPYIS